MLVSLHVKNMALIKEVEVEFGEGLNILTGETGAGKSLLIGSVNLALGGKFEKDMLRRGEENGLVELVFDCEEERLAEKIKEHGSGTFGRRNRDPEPKTFLREKHLPHQWRDRDGKAGEGTFGAADRYSRTT